MMAHTAGAATLFQHLATDTSRNLVVTAGAGTGKTATIARRMMRILREQNISLDRIVVVTFTEKAATEMKERIHAAIGEEIKAGGDARFSFLRDHFLDNRISTFHAFCAQLLREYPVEAGIDPYFRVLDEEDKVFLLRRVINRCIGELAADGNNRDLALLLTEFSRAGITEAVYTLIQKREDSGPWLGDFLELQWEVYEKRLPLYERCIKRDICFKAGRSGLLPKAMALLAAAEPNPPDDDSSLSQRREALLELCPKLQTILMRAGHEDFDTAPVIQMRDTILENTSLKGANSLAWRSVPESLELLKDGVEIIRAVLSELDLEDFDINRPVEKEGFALCKALAGISTYCMDTYRREKQDGNYLDFQDLQLKILALFRSEKNAFILRELREKYVFLMVDEFQDTNSIQWEIVKAIASDAGGNLLGDRLFIVGDEKQAIYSFRGGDVTLFAKAHRELIETNRRTGSSKKPFLLVSHKGGDYSEEYVTHVPDEESIKSGRIVFGENFRSAQELVVFFNLFFAKLLTQEVYEDFEARPQTIRCAGNPRRGSVELLLVDKDAVGRDESLDTEPSDASDIDVYAKEAHIIAAKIKEVLLGDDPLYDHVRRQASKGKPAIAILLRRRTKIKFYEEALRRESIDFIVVRGKGFYQRQEIVDLGNLFGFLADRSNSIYLAGYLRSPVGHVSDEGIYALSRIGGNKTLWEKLAAIFDGNAEAHKPRFTDEDFRSLESAYRRLVRYRTLSGKMVLGDFIRYVLDEDGYYASLSRGRRGDQAISNVEKLIDRAREEAVAGRLDFPAFAAWLDARIDRIEEEGEADIDAQAGGAVQLLTVHQSKGLEFPLVCVPDLASRFNFGTREDLRFDQVTHTLSMGNDEIHRVERFEVGIDAPDPENKFELCPTLVKRIMVRRGSEKTLAEMKRLFYVAVTRAMDHLVLVGQFSSGKAGRGMKHPNQATCWMDWIAEILGMPGAIGGKRGTIPFTPAYAGLRTDVPGGDEGIEIAYRLFEENESIITAGEELRTDFSPL